MSCLPSNFWLVVLTIFKHISQWEGLSHMMENQNVPNHQPDFEDTCLIFCSPTSGIVPKTHHNGPEGVSWYQQPRHQKLCCYCGDAIPSGWWYTYPSEKYESQLGWLFPTYGEHVPNHQSVLVSSMIWGVRTMATVRMENRYNTYQYIKEKETPTRLRQFEELTISYDQLLSYN